MHLPKFELKDKAYATFAKDQAIPKPASSNSRPDRMLQLEILSPDVLCPVQPSQMNLPDLVSHDDSIKR